MASTHQTRDRSRNGSFDGYSETSAHKDDSTPKAGTKRLFSNRESRQLEHSQDRGENAEHDYTEEEVHSEKRHRTSDWPLKSTSPSSSTARRPLHNRNAPNSPSSARRTRSPIRPSKFVEGSMNDRVSQKPPVPYLDPDDEFLEEYNNAGCGEGGGRKLARPRKFTHSQNASAAESSVADRSETSRHSIFRFGKSIAASFNPTNWRIWTKQQPPQEDEETAQLRILQDRQAKAEQLYQELKESGHFRDAAVGSRLFQPPEQQKVVPAKHDSGIEFGDADSASTRGSKEMSREEKRKGRVFLEPPSFHNQSRGESPGSNFSGSVDQSNTSSPNKQSFHFKKPSLSNIKKAFISDYTSNASSNGDHQARRVPSRKDLQKQQKLVKRVSNLEERLKQARSQLAEALSEPIPSQPLPAKVTRSRFVPGALASLPSERLLSGYVSSEAGFSDSEMSYEIGKAVTTDTPLKDVSLKSGILDSQYKPKADAHNLSASPVSLEKDPEGQDTPREDRVVQSVEDEDMVDVESAAGSQAGHSARSIENASTSIEESANITNLNGSEDQKDNLDEETTPKPKQANPPNKKRKSIFERVPDDGGSYTPSEASDRESDIESDIKSDAESETKSVVEEITPKQKIKQTVTLTRPRKLQKTVQEPKDNNVSKSSPDKSQAPLKKKHTTDPVPQKRTVGTANPSVPSRQTNFKKPLTSPPPPPPNRLSKPKTRLPQLPNRQQSASPPPSSPFTGLDYLKPSATAKPSIRSIAPTSTSPSYSADPATETDIPPMPKMPKAVRLASGELVSTEGKLSKPKSKATLGLKGGLERRESQKENHQVEGGLTRSKQSFEWPDDVF